MTEFRHTDDRLVHEGGVWNVVVGSFLDPDGESFTSRHRPVFLGQLRCFP